MSGKTTVKMISAYIERATAPMFLSSFFKSNTDSFHNSEEVEFDVERDGEDVAIVLTDLSQGPRHNESSVLTNKRVKPPIYDEEGVLSGFELINRETGRNPFEDPNYTANAISRSFRLFAKMERKIRRSIELMASQVLQTGVLTLIDKAGNTLYSLDFQPKSTHFPGAATAWGTNGADPLADLESLAAVIRRDGKVNPNKLIFGATAMNLFLQDANVQARIKRDSLGLGELAPVGMPADAVWQGYIWIGNYRFEMWTYDGFYKHPQTGVLTPYVAVDNVIMLSSESDLELTFGRIPQIIAPDPRLEPFLSVMPDRLPNVAGGMDLTTNAWITADNRNLKVGCGTRPLTIPKGIDTFGCLTAVAS